MRVNMPVTGKEYVLRDDHMIVSKTDTRGIITYINRDFLEVSGFTEDELIGSPHNLVRHPDMPPEAFKDLWETLQKGMPWTGLVKNRCKNGDHYWVVANATPIWEGGQITGYMSVRGKPTQQQIDAANKIYASLKAGEKTWTVRHGRVEKNSLLNKLNPFKNISIKGRLTAMIGLTAALLLTVGGIGLLGLSQTDEGLRTVYEDRTVALGQLDIIVRNLNLNRMNMAEMIIDPSPESVRSHTTDFAERAETITKTWDAYMATTLTPEEKKLADQFAIDRGRFVKEGLKPIAEAMKAGQLAEAKRIYEGQLDELFTPVRKGINALIQLQLDVAKQEYEAAQTRYGNIRNISIAAIVLGIALAIWMGWLIIRAISRPLAQTSSVFAAMSGGKYDNVITVEHEDEVGKVLNSLRSMQTKLGFDVAETQRIANENLRIKIGLDNVSTGVMIADADRKIIYVNKSVVDILGRAEADIKKQLPSFSASNLVGTNIDIFHKNPAHQAQLLSNLNGTHAASLTIGPRHMVVRASPVINERGQRLGSVAEWTDRTAEVGVEQEVAELVGAAAAGDFSRRLSAQGKTGFFLQLAEGINKLVETSERGMNDVARVLKALAEGDLTKPTIVLYTSGGKSLLLPEADVEMNRHPYFVDGNFTLYEGECRSILEDVSPGSVDLIFADPPYNLSNGGFTCHAGKRAPVDKGGWDISAGVAEDFSFHAEWIAACRKVLSENGSIWISGTYHSIYACGHALRLQGFEFLNDICWFKPNAPPNISARYFTASHETHLGEEEQEWSPHLQLCRYEGGGLAWRWPEETGKADEVCVEHPVTTER